MLVVPLEEGGITLAIGPSLGYEDARPSTLAEARGWTPGATGRFQVAFPVSRTLGLALGVSGTASADGFRPASRMGLALRLGD